MRPEPMYRNTEPLPALYCWIVALTLVAAVLYGVPKLLKVKWSDPEFISGMHEVEAWPWEKSK